METIVGFVAGYLVGSREGREGLARMRSSLQSIRTSPELRRLAGEAITVAGATISRASSGRAGIGLPSLKELSDVVGSVTEVLAHQAAAPRKRAA
jgi:hypothetical protein